MSGTSLDGLDIAFCQFRKNKSGWSYSIDAATTIAYTPEQKKMLGNLMTSTAEELAFADAAYGKLIGQQVKRFISSRNIKPHFVSSHGHTIFHQPGKGFTYQIGSGAAIHAACGIPVVSDLRSVDVSLGGQGAPLVPIGDKLLFGKYEYCLNLGGISNISFDHKRKRTAFDISPVNIILNSLASEKGKEYDQGGKMAMAGKINEPLFEALNELSFYKEKVPKSLGREWIDSEVFPLIHASAISTEDKLATVCEHIAVQISSVAKSNSPRSARTSSILVTGGGAFNKFLVGRIREKLSGEMELIVPDRNTIMFKEALIFAFLGVLKIRNENNALQSVTGAVRDSIGGALYGRLPF